MPNGIPMMPAGGGLQQAPGLPEARTVRQADMITINLPRSQYDALLSLLDTLVGAMEVGGAVAKADQAVGEIQRSARAPLVGRTTADQEMVAEIERMEPKYMGG